MILVTGATGTIGRPLVDVLVNEGAKVRVVIRDPGPAGPPADVEVVQGDLSHPDTVAPFLEGVTALFLHPRAVGLAAAQLLALARQRGAMRVVALSAMNVDDPWTSSRPATEGTGTRRSRTPPPQAALRG